MDAFDPGRPNANESSRMAWVRSRFGVRGESGVGLEVKRDEPWLMRIFGGAEDDGKEGGARSDAAMTFGDAEFSQRSALTVHNDKGSPLENDERWF